MTRLWTCDGRWYRGRAAGGPGFLVIGDAASYVDPLTSQGVRKAMSSGMHAAVVANTLLREPALDQMALAFGQAEEERSYRVFRDAAVRSLIAEERCPIGRSGGDAPRRYSASPLPTHLRLSGAGSCATRCGRRRSRGCVSTGRRALASSNNRWSCAIFCAYGRRW